MVRANRISFITFSNERDYPLMCFFISLHLKYVRGREANDLMCSFMCISFMTSEVLELEGICHTRVILQFTECGFCVVIFRISIVSL